MTTHAEGPSSSWRVVTTVFHLASVSILSFCLARRSFFRISHVPPSELESRISQLQGYSIDGQKIFISGKTTNPSQRRSQLCRSVIKAFNKIYSIRIHSSVARTTAFMTLLVSFLFVFTSSVIIMGITFDEHIRSIEGEGDQSLDALLLQAPSCNIIINICIALYGLSKIFMYLFLIERAYIACWAGTAATRWSTKIYKGGLIGLLLYFVLIGVIIHGRIVVSTPSSDVNTGLSICTIGIKPYGTIPLLVYDIFLTITFASLFIKEVMASGLNLEPKQANSPKSKFYFIRDILLGRTFRRSPTNNNGSNEAADEAWEQEWGRVRNKELRNLGLRTVFASFVALFSSTLNILVLTIRNGREEGATCMRWCIADIVLNALAIFFVTQSSPQQRKEEDRPPTEEDLPFTFGDLDEIVSSKPGETLSQTQTCISPWSETVQIPLEPLPVVKRTNSISLPTPSAPPNIPSSSRQTSTYHTPRPQSVIFLQNPSLSNVSPFPISRECSSRRPSTSLGFIKPKDIRSRDY